MTTDSQPEATPQPGPDASGQAVAAGARPRWSFRKLLAIGTGVGIEIKGSDLQVTIARVRPTGIEVIGSATVKDFEKRPATEWGTELANFLKEVGAGYIAATVLLPRSEITVRQIALPGVADKDLESAIQFQIDGLHPYAEDEAVHAYARLRGTDSVLIGITRRDVVEHYAALFSEAGVKTAAFTFSAAVIYSAVRLLVSGPQPPEFVAVRDGSEATEVYGESASRPVFSASFDSMRHRAVALAVAELRLPPDSVPLSFAQLLPVPRVFPPNHDPGAPDFAEHAGVYAAALSGACPWLALQVNLLPADRRRSSSRLRYAPTAVLGTILLLLVGGLAAESKYEDSRYLNVVQSEIKKLEPVARRADSIDRKIADVRARTQALDDFRRRTQQDLDALNEITHLLEPPAWVMSLEMARTNVQVSGEAPAAADLLQKFDSSPYFRDSEFTMSITRTGSGEGFRVKTNREHPVQRPAPKPSQQPAAPNGSKPTQSAQAPAPAKSEVRR